MRIQESKKHFILFYMAGFLIGILYANILSGDYIASMGIFSEFFLTQYAQMEIETGEFLWYILRIRMLPLVLIGAAGCTRLRKGAVLLFLLWTGFLSGILMTAAVMQMGVKGIIFCMIGMMPHFLFYIAGYVILLWFLYYYPKCRWNLTKTICFFLFISLGIVMEWYVNPILVKWYIGVL